MDDQDEIRLMFVGKGKQHSLPLHKMMRSHIFLENTGKTTLIQALKFLLGGRKKEYKRTLGASKPMPQASTDGIVQSREVLLHPKDPNRRLVVNFWDFGGQEIYVRSNFCGIAQQ